jgi:toxin FitB
VTRYLLDTSVLREAIQPRPPASLLAWLDGQLDADLYLASFSIAEIGRGILEMPMLERRRELEAWLVGPEGLPALFGGRILAFDERAAEEWALLMAQGTASGRPRHPSDMLIAATASANGCVVVTLDDERFAGAVEMINPLRAAPASG